MRQYWMKLLRSERVRDMVLVGLIAAPLGAIVFFVLYASANVLVEGAIWISGMF